jgi:hypothetical protein
MCDVIGHPGWLLDLYWTHGKARKGAAELLRAQAVIYRRRGHVLNLDVEKVRALIVYGLKRGYLDECIVDCAICRQQAFLHDWVASSRYSQEQIDAILADNRAVVSPLLYRFLLPCHEALMRAGTQVPTARPEVR